MFISAMEPADQAGEAGGQRSLRVPGHHPPTSGHHCQARRGRYIILYMYVFIYEFS